MTNPLKDVLNSGVILLTGSNTTANHPIVANYIHEAVTKRGAKLIVVDPRCIKLVDIATLWLQPAVGTNVAWINGLMNVILEENLYNKAYVEERTEGFEELKACVAKYTPKYVSKITGLKEKDIIAAARLFATSGPGAILYCMGITQHTTGTNNVKCLAALSMLCGYVGVPGGGVCPLRGQNNVQGACDMGGLPNVYSGYQVVTAEENRQKFEKAWGVPKLSDKVGMTVTEMVANAGKAIKALYIMGENPVLSDADINHAEKALASLDFLVVQDIFLTETAKLAHVVLPSACFAEKEGTFSNTERKVLRVRKAVDAPGEAREDWWITAEIAKRMGYPMEYDGPEAIMKEINAVTPSYGGITYERLEKGGLVWPCPTQDHPGTPILHVGRFTRGKGAFFAIDYQPPAELADAEYPFVLTTGRVHWHYHTGTMTRKGFALNRLYPEPLAEINAQDAKKLKIADGEYVRISSRRGSITIKAMVSNITARGVVFVPFHFYEAAANRLTISALDPVSKIPELKVCAVKVEKAA